MDTILAPTTAPPAAEPTEAHFETAPALLPSAVPERKPAPAPVPGPLGAAQPAEPAPKLATQRTAEPLLPQPTQVEPPEVLPSSQELVVVNASPPLDLQLEQMSASEVSVLATRLGTSEWLKFRSQVAGWLQSINLGQYAPFVEENKVDGRTLLDLVQVTRPHFAVGLTVAWVGCVCFGSKIGCARAVNRRMASSPSASSTSCTSRCSVAV
jgi:hypothetical protein